MKRFITILFLGAMFTGCLPEYREGCPEDLRLVFELVDEYEEGTYDTRVAADILLAVFNDRYFVKTIPIEYADIAAGEGYEIRKEEYLVGNVEMVAWAASTVEGYDGMVPGTGSGIADMTLGLEPITTRAGDYYYPAQCGLYMGIAAIDEKIDEPSTHRVAMIHSSCRVEVNVTDIAGVLGSAGEDKAVYVHGSMSNMDMSLRGTGSEAIVRTPLDNESGQPAVYTTGRFGIMPSSEGQIVSVDVTKDDEIIATLTVPTSALPTGAKAGSLIIFDYVIGDAEFLVTIDGFSHRVVIIDGV